jgi:hypothetical protein
VIAIDIPLTAFQIVYGALARWYKSPLDSFRRSPVFMAEIMTDDTGDVIDANASHADNHTWPAYRGHHEFLFHTTMFNCPPIILGKAIDDAIIILNTQSQ